MPRRQPDLIARVEHSWPVTVGEPIAGTTEGCVARARLADGTAAEKLIAPE